MFALSPASVTLIRSLPHGWIHDNAIGFNDFRGTTTQLVLTPDALDTTNVLSRNLGDNRGHGLHPKAFVPEWVLKYGCA
jgi:hypothetical protein